MEQYNIRKQLTDKKLHNIRQRGQRLTQRYSDLLERQHTLTQQNGGTDIKGSDKIHLNVGGTDMYALRETLTKIKGSRLEALFSGRWEDKLIRDEKGRVFLDMDVRYFKKIMEQLNLYSIVMSKGDDNNTSEFSNWPKFPDKTEQKTLELYIDLLCLRKESPGKDENTHPFVAKKSNNNSNNEGSSESCQDLLEAVKNEAQELDEIEEKLDKMEKELEEEEEFVSFFTTAYPQVQKRNEKGSDGDIDDAISFTSLASDLGSITSSTCYHQKQNGDNQTNSQIVNLWIDGEIVSVKRSTLCVHKDSLLAENFNDISWMNKHTLTTKDGTEVVLMGYSSVMLSIINQLRLKSMMVEADQLPKIVGVNKLESVENIVLKLFPGIEGFVLGKEKDFDSEVITSGAEFDFSDHLMTWLEEVDRRSEPKLLEIINC